MSIEIKISKKRIPYKMAMLYLNKRVEEVKNGTNRELLWILEHPTTYTAGISFNKKEIIDKKIKIIKSNRGGKITLHNPGQKIIYFVIDLNNRKKDIRKLSLVESYIESNKLDQEVLDQTEIQIKYKGYIEKEKANADKLQRLEDIKIPVNFDYNPLASLSNEAKEKLNKIRPSTLSQASRISGIKPSDISVLLVKMGR